MGDDDETFNHCLCEVSRSHWWVSTRHCRRLTISSPADYARAYGQNGLWAKRLMGKTAHGQNAQFGAYGQNAHFSAHAHTRNSARLLTDDLEAMLTDLASRVLLYTNLEATFTDLESRESRF